MATEDQPSIVELPDDKRSLIFIKFPEDSKLSEWGMFIAFIVSLFVVAVTVLMLLLIYIKAEPGDTLPDIESIKEILLMLTAFATIILGYWVGKGNKD
tara:strand:+ start:1396 stop:1689 length:294 start_codon:yes stop_codon:yes gene_type:complete